MPLELISVRIALLSLLLLSVVGVSTSAQGQALRPLSQTLLKSLADIDVAIDRAEKAIHGVKVEDVKLSGQERKSLEDTRSRTMRSVELVRKQTELLRRRQTLQDLYALKGVVDGFERQLGAFITRVHRIELRQDGDASGRASNWIDTLERSADSLEAAVLAFDGEALDLLAKADNALSSRAGGRR